MLDKNKQYTHIKYTIMTIHTTQAIFTPGLSGWCFEVFVWFIQTKKPDTTSVSSSSSTSTEFSSFKTESC